MAIRDNHGDSPWSFVQRVCREALESLPSLAVPITDLIRESNPSYAVVALRDHRVAVAEQLSFRLNALMDRRPLSESDLRAAASLAALRAEEGVPIDAVIAAYQAGDQAIWHLLVERSSEDVDGVMAQVGSMLFEGAGATTTIMARAHSRVARDIDGGRITLGHQLLSQLDDPAQHAAAAMPAARLGLDPAGSFVGLVWERPDIGTNDTHEATVALQAVSVAAAVRVVDEHRFEMVAQVDDASRVVAEVTEALPGGRLGVGESRAGIGGAAMSLGDARLAVCSARSGNPVVHFSRAWLESLAMAERHRLPQQVQAAAAVAQTHRHLSDSVMMFATADMSIARASKMLQLHPNSLTYRLDRWSTLTGLDVRTFAGLSASLVSCRLAQDD